jgi:hypothetical protein
MRAPLIAITIAFAFSASPCFAAATDVRQVVEAAGLMGEWSPDCSAPASYENPHEIIAEQDGVLTSWIAMGGNDTKYRFVSGRPLGNGDWEFGTVFEGDGRGVQLTYRVDRDRQTTWRSVDADGRVLVEDNRITANGEIVPWYQRCEQAPQAVSN